MDHHVMLLKSLSDPTRLRLLKLILHEELCVCELQELLAISQPAVSQHIAKLKTAGLVKERRAGLWTYYQGEKKRLERALQHFAAFLDTPPANIPAMEAEVQRRTALNRAASRCDTPQPGN